MKKILLVVLSLLAACASGESDRAALKEELKREILSELREAPLEGAAPLPGPTGGVEGRLIFNGGGIAECHVKLVRLLVSDTFLGMMNEARLGAEFESSSDVDGRFVFPAVPLGSYRLLWQIPGESGWIRRLREKPDAVVEAGKVSKVTDIDLGRRPIGTVYK